MKRFYTAMLQSRLRPAAALRRPQVSMLKGPPLDAPSTGRLSSSRATGRRSLPPSTTNASGTPRDGDWPAPNVLDGTKGFCMNTSHGYRPNEMNPRPDVRTSRTSRVPLSADRDRHLLGIGIAVSRTCRRAPIVGHGRNQRRARPHSDDQDGLALNAATLTVRALVCAVGRRWGAFSVRGSAIAAAKRDGFIRSPYTRRARRRASRTSRDGTQVVGTFGDDLTSVPAGSHRRP